MPQTVAQWVVSVVVQYFGTGAAALVVAGVAYVAAYVGVVYAITAGVRKVFGLDVDFPADERGRTLTTRGTIEPAKVVYGQALVSGPIFFIGTSGIKLADFYNAIALTWHEVESITDIWLDGFVIPNSAINGGAAAGGLVTGGIFGPIQGFPVVLVNKHLGTTAQTVDTVLDAAFSAWTSAHRAREVAYIMTRFSMYKGNQELWAQRNPANIAALVKGRKVYDPRLDSTQTTLTPPGSGAHRHATESTWAWSENPSLCTADFLTNTKYWEAVPFSKVDWQDVLDAADHCEELVAIPTAATEPRFTCNGVIFLTANPDINLGRLLSCFNGTLVYTGGLWHIRSDAYEAPTLTLDESWVAGHIELKTGLERTERFNTVEGIFIDPANSHRATDFPRVGGVGSGWYTRDHSFELIRNITLPFTNKNFEAQRLAYKMLYKTDEPLVMVVPCNLKGLQLTIEDRVSVKIDDLGFVGGSTDVFKVVAVDHAAATEISVNLTLKQDSTAAYADPIEGDYTTITLGGALDFATGRRIEGDADSRHETFVYTGVSDFEQRWTVVKGASPVIALVDDATGGMGEQVLQVGDNSGDDEFIAYMDLDEKIPLERNILYRVTFRIKRISGAGSPSMFLGVAGVAADGIALVNTAGADLSTTQHYFAANSVEPATGSFIDYVGYFWLTGGTADIKAGITNIASPGVMHPDSHFVTPIMYLHNAAEAAQSNIAYVNIAKVDYLTQFAIGSLEPQQGGLIANGNFRQRRWDDVNQQWMPAGWYLTNTAEADNKDWSYQTDYSVARLGGASADTDISIVSTAFPVTSGALYRIKYRLRGDVADLVDGLFLQVKELNTDLPEGKVATGSSISGPPPDVALIELSTTTIDTTSDALTWIEGGTDHQDDPVPTTITEYVQEYRPSLAAKWASLSIANWTGHGTNELWLYRASVELVFFAPENVVSEQPLSGTNIVNPNMRLPMPRDPGRPAGWWCANSVTNLPFYNNTPENTELRIQHNRSVNSSAFRVDPAKLYKISVRWKGSTTMTAAGDVRIAELDTELDIAGGKYCVGGTGAGEAEVQTRTRLGVRLGSEPRIGNKDLTTTYSEETGLYRPTSTALWASLSIHDSAVAGEMIVDYCMIEEALPVIAVAIPATFTWDAITATTYSPVDTTVEIEYFWYRGDVEIASRLVRGTITGSTGHISTTNVSSTGEATTLSARVGNASEVNTTTCTHTDSGVKVAATWRANKPGFDGGPTK